MTDSPYKLRAMRAAAYQSQRDPRTDPQAGDVLKDVSDILKPGYVNDGFKFSMTCNVVARDGNFVFYEVQGGSTQRPVALGQWIFWARNAVVLTSENCDV